MQINNKKFDASESFRKNSPPPPPDFPPYICAVNMSTVGTPYSNLGDCKHSNELPL